MSEHTRKCQSEFFQAAIDGDKTWELRLGDSPIIGHGDTLRLVEITTGGEATGREATFRIGFSAQLEPLIRRFYTRAQLKQHGLIIYSLLPLEVAP